MSSTLLDFNPEAESLDEESFEASGLAPLTEVSVLNEAQEMELASNLLDLRQESSLQRYIDHLISSVALHCGKQIAPEAARELSRLLGVTATKALSLLDPQHPMRTGSTVAQFFGLELEGLSREDQEFEAVKAFVRLVESAARRLINTPHGRSPRDAARRALAEAARRHAPGLLAVAQATHPRPAGQTLSPNRTEAGMSSSPTGGPPRIALRSNAPITEEYTMHDIDRTSLEYGQQESTFESGQFGEFGQPGEFGQSEWSGESQYEALGEAEQVELAAELLSVSNEAELEQFLGDLVKKVGQFAGQAIRSPIGQALIPVLKSAAAKALPLAGGAVGGYFGGPLGAQIGTGLANAAGQALGFEAESLSNEDREFEGAKQFVKLAAQTVQNAAGAPPNQAPASIAQSAAIAAAKALAPALLGGQQGGGGMRQGQPGGMQQGGMGGQMMAGGQGVPATNGRRHSGRWVRKGRAIVLLGV
jgi:hypothetical protein